MPRVWRGAVGYAIGMWTPLDIILAVFLILWALGAGWSTTRPHAWGLAFVCVLLLAIGARLPFHTG